jgi:hypothetical protein
MFKYEVMKPEFKLADASLMREVELLQTSAAFLFGAGVVAGFVAGSPTTQGQTQNQDLASAFGPTVWILWGVTAISLLSAVLSAFFARMTASMLWSLAKDYLDRFSLVYDPLDADTAPELESARTALQRKHDKVRETAQLQRTNLVGAINRGTGTPGSTDAQLSADTGALPTQAGTSKSARAQQRSPTDEAAVAKLASDKKARMKQIIYWDTLSIALVPGIRTVAWFISFAKVCFLAAVMLWLVIFVFIAVTKANNDTSRWVVSMIAAGAIAVMTRTVICMVRNVYRLYLGYHARDKKSYQPKKVPFWPGSWTPTFTFHAKGGNPADEPGCILWQCCC